MSQRDLQRFSSQTFQNQAKFWLDRIQILEMYANRKLEQNLMNSELAQKIHLRDEKDAANLVIFMQGGCRAFSFRKNMKQGQYVLPFSFKLPDDIPGTFEMQMRKKGEDGRTQPGHKLRICYTVEVFVESTQNTYGEQEEISDSENVPKFAEFMKATHEFEVREFLFTNDEIKQDVQLQDQANKVKQLFKTSEVLKPMF